MRHKLAPGERLRVEHLKDQYQVVAGTLREALSLLGSDALMQSYDLLAKTEVDLAESGSDRWDRRNKAFHEALIAGFDSTWSKYLLSILYRNINWRLTAAHASGRDVRREHEDIFRAAIDRQEARAALALEAHVWLTHDIVKRQAQLGYQPRCLPAFGSPPVCNSWGEVPDPRQPGPPELPGSTLYHRCA